MYAHTPVDLALGWEAVRATIVVHTLPPLLKNYCTTHKIQLTGNAAVGF